MAVIAPPHFYSDLNTRERSFVAQTYPSEWTSTKTHVINPVGLPNPLVARLVSVFLESVPELVRHTWTGIGLPHSAGPRRRADHTICHPPLTSSDTCAGYASWTLFTCNN